MHYKRALALLTFLVAACGSDDATPEGEILLPEDRCRAVGLASCDNGGRCIEDKGTPRCACAAGYTGPTCAECAPGAVCGTGACAAKTCTPHAGCREENGAAVCSCAVGYRSEGEACVWKGVVEDPTFQGMPLGAWTVGAGKLNVAALGGKDPGLLEVGGATCTTGVGARQTVMMPPVELAEPLALEVSGLAHCISVDGEGNTTDIACDRPLVMGVGPRAFEPFLSLDVAPQTSRQCLGDRAFGKAIELAFSASACGSVSTAVDHAEIVPAPECPLPGQIPNGDFEGAGGWKAETATGIAEVASGVGNKSSRGGRLKTSAQCQAPQLRGAISVPGALAKPAITFTARGGIGRRMRVLAGDALVGVVTGTNVFETATFCLPDFAKGQAISLAFTGGGDKRGLPCTDADDYEFVFDDVQLKSEPVCPDAAPVVDGSFERPDADRYWFANLDLGANVSYPKTGGADGAGFLSLNQLQCQRFSTVNGSVTIPEAMPGAGGPSLAFKYRAQAANNTFYSGPAGALPPAALWTDRKLCLPTRYAGAPYTISFGISSGNNCQGSLLAIDAITVGHDPSCPEQ